MLQEIPIERPQRAESELNGRAAELTPSKGSQEVAEILAAQPQPIRRCIVDFFVPPVETIEGLGVVADRVAAGTASGS